ncbi:MAG: hypothetical protein M1835_007326 [Candelina submexicana]|nr:MAG: hypothetical protein M1835_007326 [Candelina submexicana]
MSNQGSVANGIPTLTFAEISDTPALWTKQHDLFVYDLIKKGDPSKMDETVEIIEHELLIAFPYIFNETHPVFITGLKEAIRMWSSDDAPPREIFFDGQAGEDAKQAWLDSRSLQIGENEVPVFGLR